MCLLCKKQSSGNTRVGYSKALGRSVLFLSNMLVSAMVNMSMMPLQTVKLSMCEAFLEGLRVKRLLSEQALLCIISLCVLSP